MWICFYRMHFDARYFYTAMVDDMRYHLRSTSLFSLSYTLHTHSFIALRLWRMQKKLTFFFRDYWIFFYWKTQWIVNIKFMHTKQNKIRECDKKRLFGSCLLRWNIVRAEHYCKSVCWAISLMLIHAWILRIILI